MVSKRGFISKKKMASLETNVSEFLEVENTLDNSITIENLILDMEELKRLKSAMT